MSEVLERVARERVASLQREATALAGNSEDRTYRLQHLREIGLCFSPLADRERGRRRPQVPVQNRVAIAEP